MNIKIPRHIHQMLAKNARKYNLTPEQQILNMLQDKFIKSKITIDTQSYIVKVVKNVVSDYYRLPADVFITRSRKRELCEPRFAAIYFSKKFTKFSLRAIGEHFCGVDHSSVIHAVNTYDDLIFSDSRIRNLSENINQAIKDELQKQGYEHGTHVQQRQEPIQA